MHLEHVACGSRLPPPALDTPVPRLAKLKRARLAAREWNRNLRSVYFFLFKYTASLRGVRRADGQLWTDEQRTAEAQRLYPLAALNLMAGRVDDDALQTISHPAAKLKESEWSWAPPESALPPSQPPACPASHATLPASTSTSSGGFVKVRGLVWEILESWVRDPRCLDKFGFFIDNRSTACAAQPATLLAAPCSPCPIPPTSGTARLSCPKS